MHYLQRMVRLLSRRMKDSRIEWIGEIPEYWDTVKIKHLADHKEGLFLDGDWIESDIITSEGVRYLTTGNIGEGYFKEQGDGFISEETLEKMNCLIVYPGDLVISRLNKPIGRACLLPDTHEKYVIAVDNVVLRPNPKLYNRLFLKFAMNIDGYSEEANMISRGATMPRISRTLLGNIKLPIPPYHQQQNIANFLDKKVAEIDHILEKTRESIEEYKKYKQSTITEAVTKGLNPDVKMKDSGIEWIGEIPEHWETTKLKNICSMKSGTNLTSQDILEKGSYPVYGGNGLRGYYSRYSQEGKYILIGRQGALCGNVLMVEGKFWPTEHAIVTTHKSNSDIDYLEHLLYSMNLNQYSISSAQPGLAVSEIVNLEICLPPLTEQKLIQNYLKNKVEKINYLIGKKGELILNLTSYKQSLVYECITGKREV